MREESCKIPCFNEEKVKAVKAELAAADIFTISQLFKVVADEHRFKILYALTKKE